MADKRIQQYPEKVAPSTSDYLLVADAEDVDVNGYLKYKKVKISSLDNIVITNAEDITLTAINTLISTNALVIGRFYRITNSASGVNPILVQAVALNVLSDIGISSVNGTVYNYDISTDTVSVPYAGVYVPYTGATTNVDLGEYQIKVGQLELDQTPTGTFGVGKIRWNDTDGTPEVMLKGANVTLQIGQEQLARVVNKTNTNLTEAGYQVVRISGAQGQRLKVGLAQANSTSTCKDTLGLVTENISNNAEGFITTSGLVRSINTTGSLQGETWADGDRIYLSPSVAGGITNVEPSAPNIVIVLGYVVYAHANQGSIYVSVEGAKALHELFDVSIPTPTNNNVLVYESSTGLWKDKSISTILGFTPIANNATVGGELSGTLPNPSLVTSAVTGKALTGLSVSGSAVVSTDSILTGIGKLQNQINAVLGSVNFQGVWNASTNTPTLTSSVGTKGYYYIVTVAGSTNLNGITDWKLGDWAIYDGSAWQKVDNTDAVVSVNGYTGIVTLAKADIGLGNVENTALSTWAGSGNITTLGTISSGVWNGTAIGDTYISSASTWNAKIGGSGTTNYLPKFTGTSALGDSLIYDNGTNVGIGTENPTAKFQIKQNANNVLAGLRIEKSDNDTSLFLCNNGSANLISSSYGSTGAYVPLYFQTSDLNRLVIDTNGNVGIGTTSPVYKTQIVSDGNALLQLNGKNTTGALDTGFTISADDSKNIYLYQRENAFLDIGTNNGSAMRIASSRNVLIGTTTDDTVNKLQINGSFKANALSTIITSNGNVLDFGLSGSPRITLYQNATLYGFYNNTSGLTNFSINNSTGAATFSSSVTAGGQVTSTNVASAFRLLSGSDTLFSIGYIGGTIIDRLATTNFFIAENGSPQLTIASGGAATFSSSVTSNSYINSLGRTTAFGFRLPDWQIYNTSGGALAFNNYTTDFLTIASGGSATFSQSVTVGASTNGRLGVRGTTNDSSAYAFEATNSSGSTLFIVRNDNVTSVDGKFLIGTFTPGASKLSVVGLPTSASGLSTGDIWNDSGTLKIV